MASPSISSVSASQGTGGTVKVSVVEILTTFSADNNCNFLVELSVDNGATFHTAITHSAANGLNLAPGSSKSILLDVAASFAQTSFPATGSYTQAIVRLTATDPIQTLSSATHSSSSFALKSSKPVINSATMSQFIGGSIANGAPLVMTATDGASGSPSFFRANLSINQLDPSSSLAFVSYGSGTVTFAFPGGASDGQQYVYVRVYDSFFNLSDVASISTWLQREAPTNCVVDIVGSVGNSDYTGIAIAEDGSFTVDRSVVLRLRGTSPLVLSYKILLTSNVEVRSNINSTYLLNAVTATPTVYLTTNPANPNADNYNTDATVSVNVQFVDQAGNVTTSTSSIRLNTRLYKTAYAPLRLSDSVYQPLLREVTSGGAEVVIPATIVLSDNPVRLWRDIFYPATHSFPVDGDGNFDPVAGAAMAGVSSTLYDAPLLSGGQVVVDGQNRPVINAWTTDGTKNYGNMISGGQATLTYWVIDTTGTGQYTLEFEHFDVNANSYGPPFNMAAPYRGDMLVVYNATAAGCLHQTTDDFGNPVLSLADSSLLKEMYAFTGSGTNVLNLTTGQRMNSSPIGAFNTDAISGINKIVLMFFSDAATTASGFRLKSSPGINRVWKNYDLDPKNGQMWIHKYATLGTAPGAADATLKRFVYDYLDQAVEVDYDRGWIIFNVPPSGGGVGPSGARVEADYSYHGWDPMNPPGPNWLAGNDDFIDYADAPIFSQGPTPTPNADQINNRIFEIDGYGRYAKGFVWDKDRGMVQLDPDHYPVGASGVRLWASYPFHTFKRLTNDGYGNLLWNDQVIVADVTPLYPNFTFADVMIVNEGSADLEKFKVVFVPRGYDTNNDGQVVLTGSNVVDQVLDINRPWDIQLGTRLETYGVMALQIDSNYLWQRSQTQQGAQDILSNWFNRVAGTIASHQTLFGRAVWVLGGTSGSNFPPTTPGEKVCSIEATGSYYQQTIN